MDKFLRDVDDVMMWHLYNNITKIALAQMPLLIKRIVLQKKSMPINHFKSANLFINITYRKHHVLLLFKTFL